MSRTYRLRKAKHEADEIRHWHSERPQYVNNIPDGCSAIWNFHPLLKWYTNQWRRADDRRYEHEAMLYGETQFIEHEKAYKRLYWRFD